LSGSFLTAVKGPVLLARGSLKARSDGLRLEQNDLPSLRENPKIKRISENTDLLA